MCRELGLSCRTEENEGILFVDFNNGGQAPEQSYGGHQQQQHSRPQGHQQKPQQHQGQQHQQQDNGNDELEKLAHAVLPKVIKKLEKMCCIMM